MIISIPNENLLLVVFFYFAFLLGHCFPSHEYQQEMSHWMEKKIPAMPVSVLLLKIQIFSFFYFPNIGHLVKSQISVVLQQ